MIIGSSSEILGKITLQTAKHDLTEQERAKGDSETTEDIRDHEVWSVRICNERRPEHAMEQLDCHTHRVNHVHLSLIHI